MHPTAFSHKFFAAIEYKPEFEKHSWKPYLAFEADVELGAHHRAVNQWAVNFLLGINV